MHRSDVGDIPAKKTEQIQVMNAIRHAPTADDLLRPFGVASQPVDVFVGFNRNAVNRP
jgi:hypothetical protein